MEPWEEVSRRCRFLASEGYFCPLADFYIFLFDKAELPERRGYSHDHRRL
jgi:hypothetical protein